MFSVVEDVNRLAPPKNACAASQGAEFRVQLAIDTCYALANYGHYYAGLLGHSAFGPFLIKVCIKKINPVI
jgi:hypothetical protein